jgi:ferredoxin
MIEVTVDRATCRGYANCVLAAADVFDLDDEGKVVLKASTVEDSQVGAIRRAAYDCPTDSISFTGS